MESSQRKHWQLRLHEVIFEPNTAAGKAFDVALLFSILATTSQIILDGASLPAGTYSYTLYVDSKKIDTKQMVIGR
jgi:hypothetical protein